MVLDAFLQYLRSEKHYSQHTIRAYSNDLKSFHDFLGQHFQIQDARLADHKMIRAWLTSQFQQNRKAISIKRKSSALKTFYKYLVKRHGLQNNPMLRVSAPKTGFKLPTVVEGKSLNILLQGKHFDSGFIGQRDRIVLEILYGTGIRLSELINLKVDDIDFTRNQFLVTGKRNKQRIVPFGPYLSSLLQEYLNIRHSAYSGNVNSPFLILTNKMNKAYPSMLYTIVRNYLSMVTTKQKRSPHVLRHSFATEMLNHGADLNAVKEILGHSSLASTQVYTHNTIERLKKIYELAHPKA